MTKMYVKLCESLLAKIIFPSNFSKLAIKAPYRRYRFDMYPCISVAFVLVFITNLTYSFVVFNSYAEVSVHCLLEKRFLVKCFFFQSKSLPINYLTIQRHQEKQ